MINTFYFVLYFSVYSCLVVSELLTYRLSTTEAIPKNYELTVKPDFDNEIFHGEVSIYVDTTDSLDGITLHSHNLNISEVYINRIKGYYEKQSEERITVKYNNMSIQPGEHVLFIKYTGKFGTDAGFIKATNEYKETKGYVFVTDLEPTMARMVFPCFDEPSFKAIFNIRLISPNETFKAISNMPEINKFVTTSGVGYEFAPSVKMSTYLVSFAFTNYPYYEEVFEYKGRKIPIRIYTLNASQENNAFAMKCTETSLRFYSDYTGISYPLAKLDMIEYKRTESAATENWGLITFREGLLTTPLKIYTKFQIKLVIFHELSHFWFGNLVTNVWWNDIWLQEGFATYMSYKLSAVDNDSNKQLTEMKAFGFNAFFDKEIFEKSYPIVSYLPDQNTISKVFNYLVYEKASAVLLMLEDEIGEEKFRQLVKRFLNKHVYSVVTTNDFISTVEEIAPEKPLRTFLESYLYQKNYPAIYVDIVDNSTYVLKQEFWEALTPELTRESKWTIPIDYRTDVNITTRLWFHRDMDELRIEERNVKWIIFNIEGNGMYKIIWSRIIWDKILKNFELMDNSATETLISDAYFALKLSKIDCDILLHLMEKGTTLSYKKLMLFYAIYEYLTTNLSCHNFTDETKLFQEFYKQTIRGLKKYSDIKQPESCDDQYIIKKEDSTRIKHLTQCATWIRENLKEKVSNVIKENI